MPTCTHKLLANCLAQSQALMLGKTTEAALAEKAPTASAGLGRDGAARTAAFPATGPAPRCCWTR
jgi:glucose-6-phosphate isomerase